MDDSVVRKLAAIMFTDIEGYTAFVQKDEKVALQKVAIHRKYLEEFTKAHNGEVIAFYGDGSLSIYNSALDAVNCGIAMQKAYQADHPIPVRIGIHVGDIVFKDETVYGDGVNIASRIEATGIAGSIFISDRVQAELTNHPEISTKFVGKKSLKNVKEPIGVYAITNEGLQVPSGMTKLPDLKKFFKYIPLLLIGPLIWWLIDSPFKNKLLGEGFINESISVPLFSNNTGDATLDFISQMGSHWTTKELSATNEANVVSYESASEMLQMSGLNLSSSRGRKQYEALTGAVNVVEAFFIKSGANLDSLVMTGRIVSLNTGAGIKNLTDVSCKAENPMECIQALSGEIKGYWASRGEKLLTAPNYEAYKAFLAAKHRWREGSPDYVREQLQKAIILDPGFIDPYFLMLDLFFNEDEPQAAYDTLQSIRKRFTDLDKRQTNMLNYHEADILGKNDKAYSFFLSEYAIDPKDLFINNTAMVMAMMYKHNAEKSLEFFKEIPKDSLQTEGCSYCADRFEVAMWAALDAGNMSLADELAVKVMNALHTRTSYGTLIMYHVWKNDTTSINKLIKDSRSHIKYDASWEYLNYLAGRLFLVRNQPQIASEYFGKCIERREIAPIRYIMKCYYFDNQLDLALQLCKKRIKEDTTDSPMLQIELGMIYARQGNATEAKNIITLLEGKKKAFDYGLIEYHQGRIYALLDEKQMAVDHISKAIDKGWKYDLWITFDHDPDLVSLKKYPAYMTLMEQFK